MPCCGIPGMRVCGPEIANSVYSLCLHVQNPGPAHWHAAKQVLLYLKGTHTKGVAYSKSSGLALLGFVDASYADNYWNSKK